MVFAIKSAPSLHMHIFRRTHWSHHFNTKVRKYFTADLLFISIYFPTRNNNGKKTLLLNLHLLILYSDTTKFRNELIKLAILLNFYKQVCLCQTSLKFRAEKLYILFHLPIYQYIMSLVYHWNINQNDIIGNLFVVRILFICLHLYEEIHRC